MEREGTRRREQRKMRKETEMSQESHGMVEMGREWGKGRKERRKEGVKSNESQV